MPTTSAKKSSRPAKASAPTWSRAGGGRSSSRGGERSANGKAKASPRKPTPAPRPSIQIPSHVRREMVALVLLVLAALSVLGLLSWSSGNSSIVGVAGGTLAQLFGVAAWLVPLAMSAGALALLFGARSETRWLSPAVPLGLFLLLFGTMGFIHLFTSGQPAAEVGQGGGYVGLALSTLLSDYFTKVGAGVVLFALALGGFMLAFGVSLAQLVSILRPPAHTLGQMLKEAFITLRDKTSQLLEKRSTQPYHSHAAADQEPLRINSHSTNDGNFQPFFSAGEEDDQPHVEESIPPLLDEEPTELPAPSTTAKSKPEPIINRLTRDKKPDPRPPTSDPQPSPLGYIWTLPPFNLLEMQGEQKVSQADIKQKIKVIEEALQSFNVDATVREVNTGPAVTQFAIEPGVGVRVNKITQLDKDLALALAAPDIRIEAPIPGQSRVGIEVPNVSLQVVGLRDIMEADGFANNKYRLKIALGRDTHGRPVVTDLAKLPHILVAGATGSGKSVFLNSMVVGFLLQFAPDDLRMLMIDPKRVELTGFNGIPHLLRPVVTDVRMDKEQSREQSKTQNPKSKVEDRPLTAVEALKWALWEMERRYKLFARGQKGKDGISKVFRNIEQYRLFTKENPELSMEHVPYIVIIIDELADLMLTAPEEVETSLCRLAQLARATGIHLVVATQRPSVDVVTGLIKANFPARAAFAVTSQVDSKVILDTGGAEKLLGRGDMLYTASDESKPVRIQGTFVSDNETDKVVNFWRKQLPSDEELADNGIEAPVQPMQMPDWLGTGDADADSELLEQAIELVKRNSYVSVSMLQRKLRVGYNRAARLVEQMEEMGLIAPASPDHKGKPREVLLGGPDHRAVGATFEELEEESA